MLLKISTCLAIVSFVSCQNYPQHQPQVKIQQGIIEGRKIISDSGRVVNEFLGIPYAAPPLDKLRFAPPQKHPGWNGTRQTITFGPNCLQIPIKTYQQEDCLYLNVWTPENVDALLPVVFFIGGVNFQKTNEVPISGQDLSADNLIVITFNYRLNVFGFFCLGSSEARGNTGLLDQYTALIWTRANIQRFGGDPEKITLYGHGSGATSVIYHLISPRTAGLFQRAIIASGSALAPWYTSNDPIVASRNVMRMLSCDGYTLRPLECMRSKKSEHVLQALGDYLENYSPGDGFYPVVDSFLPTNNRYVTVDPSKALRDGTYLQVPVLTGISRPLTDHQYVEWLDLASQGVNQLQQYTEKRKIPELIQMYGFNSGSRDEIFNLIKWKYFSSRQGDVRAIFEHLKDLEYHAKIEAPHYLQLSLLLSSYVQPIYAYYVDDLGITPNISDSSLTTDLLLIFGPILLKQVGRKKFNSNELNLSRILREFWTNFIIFGNPTPNAQLRQWNKYTAEEYHIEYLPASSEGSERDKTQLERVLFWNQLLPKISELRRQIPTYVPKELQTSPDPAAGFRHAMYTLVGLVIALLVLLLICIVLLKKRFKERSSGHLPMGY